MKIKTKSTLWNKVDSDALVVFTTEENWEEVLKTYGSATPGSIRDHLQDEKYTAKKASINAFPTFGKIPAKSLIIIGLGKQAEFTLETMRRSVAALARHLIRIHRKRAAIEVTSGFLKGEQVEHITEAMVEGLKLGTYSFNKYKSVDEDKSEEIDEIILLTHPAKIQHVMNGVNMGEIYAQATLFARDLVNESPSVTTPTFLASVAKTLAVKNTVSVEILDEKAIRKLKMGAFLSVTRGSDEPPKFIKLTYNGGRKTVTIVGKAITFDTGGLSLKDAKNMETMKLDMAGAATVLGVFKALPILKPKATVVGYIAACENMPGAKASKPGDIVTAHDGKSIEILNTDAEGRLTLADVLAVAKETKPDMIIDIATLTGACMVALGEDIAGLFSNNKDLREKLTSAAIAAGEKVWELPLEPDYKDQIKSDVADLRNIGKSRYGGAISAALFLEEFVGTTSWAHLDIAGPAFAEKDTPLTPKGGTGFGVRTLLGFLKNL